MKLRFILIRGLMRGNGHWADFPEKMKLAFPEAEIELHEIPGNGTRANEQTPLDPIEVISKIRDKSLFFQTKEPVHLFGVSLGGMIALKWAETYPAEIKSICVVNTSLAEHSKFYQRLRPSNYIKIIRTLLNSDPYTQEKEILEIISNRSDRSKMFLQKFAEFSRRYPLPRKNFVRQLILASRINLVEKIKCPSTVLCSKEDRLVDFNCSLQVANFLGVSPLVHPTAGHDLTLDEPDWVIRLGLETFLT